MAAPRVRRGDGGDESTHAADVVPADLLRELDPRLAKTAAKYGEDCVQDIAETQVKLLGATKKFLGFMEAFVPEPPSVRPPPIAWSGAGRGCENRSNKSTECAPHTCMRAFRSRGNYGARRSPAAESRRKGIRTTSGRHTGATT